MLNADTLPPDVLASFPQYSPVSVQPGAQGPPAVAELLPAHNTIDFWSWGEDDSHLAAGATSAVLVDGQDSRAAPKVTKRPPQRTLQLHAGDVLVLEQTKDPDTGGVGPADPALRQAVRLTGTQLLTDPLFDQPLLEVQWAAEDALRFDLAVTAAGHLCGQASGNVVLVANGVAAADPLDPSAPALSRPGLSYATPFPDPRTVGRHQARRLHSIYHRWREQIAHWRTQADHGTPLSTEHLEMLALQVGDDALERLGLGATRRGLRKDIRAELDADALTELLARADRLLAGRRRRLDYLARVAAGTGPLDAVLIDELQQDWGTELTAALAPGQPGSWGPAATAISQDPRAALPILQLTDGAGNAAWRPVLDLIGAAPTDRVFVAEVNDEGIAQLRINNPPAAAGSLSGAYWVGNGAAGNVETEAINALVWVPGEQAGSVKPPALSGISVIRNPLAVVGGIEAENVAAAKLAIPGCFAVGQQRALTADDYAALAAALPGSGVAQPNYASPVRRSWSMWPSSPTWARTLPTSCSPRCAGRLRRCAGSASRYECWRRTIGQWPWNSRSASAAVRSDATLLTTSRGCSPAAGCTTVRRRCSTRRRWASPRPCTPARYWPPSAPSPASTR